MSEQTRPAGVVLTRAGRHRALPKLHREIHQLSEGLVGEVAPSGPVLAARPVRPPRSDIFVRALPRRDVWAIRLVTACWIAGLVAFWLWWLSPGHQVTLLGMVLNSSVLLYVSGYPLLFVIGVNRLKRVDVETPVPEVRVAFVVTKAPSEPWAVAQTTLSAMLDQVYPDSYDVWLCDEKPTAEVMEWCASAGVRLSTREGQAAYHRETWPRRTRCKEGNLAFFYDHWGYRNYDVVVQLDCDHRPEPDYLAHMVQPFADPNIGYVAAPSVCDANESASWAARGRLHREAALHGPLQLGHNDGRAPLCIGSHYAVRTSALKRIGGLGPELAEDFSTSFLLSVAGWNGAFAIDAEAHGDGPPTFEAMLIQEFQWSRSLATLMLGLVPRNIRLLPWRLRARFLSALTYYILLASTMMLGLALAPIAAVINMPWIRVNYFVFLGHWWLITIWLICIVWILRRRGLLRPPNAPLISYEGTLFTLTRWPYVAWGILSAVIDRIRPRQHTFKVTPKGAGGLHRLQTRLMLPFAAVALLSAAAALVGELKSQQVGYSFLSLLAAVSYTLVLLMVPLLHAREAARSGSVSVPGAWRATAIAPTVLAVAVLVAVGVPLALFPSFLSRSIGVLPFLG